MNPARSLWSQHSVCRAIIPLLAIMLSVSVQVARAESGSEISGDARTLPTGVARGRLIIQSATANDGFNDKGEPIDLGYSLRAIGCAVVAEYGVTDDLSLQILVPYVASNDLALDGDKFRRSQTYQAKYHDFLAGIIDRLISQGLCVSEADCEERIAGGMKLPVDTDLILPTGEMVTVRAGVPLKLYADSLIVGAARPLAGDRGLGDMEIGGLYRFMKSSDLEVAAGAGLRLPTGSFSDVPSAQRPTGAGLTTLGLRLNIDFVGVPGLILAWQNQLELSLMEVKKSKTSLLDNSKINSGDPESAGAISAGSDGSPNGQNYEARGAGQVGYLRAGGNLGLMSEAFRSLSTNIYYRYNIGPTEYLNGVKQSNPRKISSLSVSGEFNGLAYEIPFGATIEKSVPIAGENAPLATSILTITAKTYARF